ncbi:MAG: M24 family metallopeptidase [Candidatus Aenigmatarchaeota archaeon]
MRVVKSPEELELIKKACRIADIGAKHFSETLSPNLTERELALGIENEMRRFGAEEIAFPTIFTSGKRSSLVHPSPGVLGKKIGRGLGLADFVARVKGYCSDITVPFAVGKLSAKEEKIAKAVQKVYEKTVCSAEFGMPTWKLHGSAAESIRESGFDLCYAVGHGLGLDLHDSPSIGPKPQKIPKGWRETKLADGMVFTIEPGIHVPGVGGWRIENDFLMAKTGLKRLTNARTIKI